MLLLIGSRAVTQAQEAVSTTGSSATTSSSATSTMTSAGGTTEVSTGTAAPSTGVTSSAAEAPAVQGGAPGVGIFTPTPVQIYATVSGGYDDNVNTTTAQKQGSAFTNGNVILDYTFGDPRLQLAINAGAGGTYYYERLNAATPGLSPAPTTTTQNYDIDFKGALAVTYKASPRLTLGSTLLVEYLTEPSFDYAGGLNYRNGNYLYTTDKFLVSYAWTGRFGTKTSYIFEAFNYDNSNVGMFSNRVTNTLGNEFRLQLVPTTALIAEYRFGIVSYENSTLDSMTQFILGGIDHTFNPRLSASLRGGVELRSYDNDGDRTGPYFESIVNYAAGRRITVGWSTRYGIEEPDVPNAQSRTTFRTGLQTKFTVTSRILATLDMYYVHDDYHSLATAMMPSAPFTDDTFDAGVSVRYAINSMFSVSAGYHYSDINSDVATREYSRNRVFAGVGITF